MCCDVTVLLKKLPVAIMVEVVAFRANDGNHCFYSFYSNLTFNITDRSPTVPQDVATAEFGYSDKGSRFLVLTSTDSRLFILPVPFIALR